MPGTAHVTCYTIGLMHHVSSTKDTGMSNAAVMRRFYARFLSIRSLPVPVISAINGSAIGDARVCV